MIEFVETDESTPYVKQLQERTGPVTLVNTFTVPEERQEEFLALWRRDAAYFQRQPGFVSTQMHRGVGGSRVLVNIAVWESAAHLAAAHAGTRVHPVGEGYPEGCTVSPHLYEKVAVDGVCGD
ncbi:antibiotic biosynthesis monooxygenase family protein [Streptomyces sp. NPDC059070]|uniref:antibiotic biosynthesis monooxygenase family protein n=1 Tax=unclassified Streptomyces TaxID=2593676 RepID=UPI0034E257EA